MNASLRSILLWTFGALVAGGAAGAAATGSILGYLVLSMVVYTGLAVGAFVYPTLIVWVGLLVPALQLVYPLALLRPAVAALLVLAMMKSWDGADGHKRLVASALIGIGAWGSLTGYVLAPFNPAAGPIAFNLLFGTFLAACAVLRDFRAEHLAIVACAWGVLVSFWLMTTSDVAVFRTGDIFIGENANSLGLIASLGSVAAIGLLRRAKWKALWTLPVFGLCVQGAVASGSRGALLVLAGGVGAVVFARLFGGSFRQAVTAGAAVGLLGFFIAPLALNWFLSSSGRNIDPGGDLLSRQRILEFSIKEGLAHPVSGIGFNNLSALATRADALGLEISAHNAFAGLFAATGIIPVSLLVILAWQALARSRIEDGNVLFPLVVSVLLAGVSLEWYQTARLGPFCLIALGLGAAAGGRLSKYRDNSESLEPRRVAGATP